MTKEQELIADISKNLGELMKTCDSQAKLFKTMITEEKLKGFIDPLLEEAKKQIAVDKVEIYEKQQALAAELAELKSRVKFGPLDPEGTQKSEIEIAIGSYLRKTYSGCSVEEQTLLMEHHKKANAALSTKAMFEGSPTSGGFLVTPEMASTITRIVRERSPIRSVSRVQTIGSQMWKETYEIGDFDALWEDEKESANETANSTLNQIEIPAHNLRSSPKASEDLIDDSEIDIIAWFTENVADKHSRVEGKAFVLGDSPKRPKGYNTYPSFTGTSSDTPFGQLETITSKTSGVLAIVDDLKRLKTALLPEFHQNAWWVMNKEALCVFEQELDGFGRPLIQPDITQGGRPTIYGIPVLIAVDMPVIATDSLSVALGDFSRGYLVVDRSGIRTLRDELTDFPNVKLRMRKRVGGGVRQFQAIKRLKTKA